MPSSDKEKALRLLKQYRERLTGIGDVHYLEEVAFLIHTFESPVFEKLLRNMGGTVYTSTSRVVPSQIKSESIHHNGKVTSSSSVQTGLHHVVRTDKDNNSILLSSGNSSSSFSTATKQLSERSIQPIANGMPNTGVTNSGHTVTAPSYNFYLISSTGSQLSNTDSWGSIDLPMGDERRPPDINGYHMHGSGGTANGSLKKLPINNSPATLSPLSQVPSSNKSSSSSMSGKSVVTVSDSNKGPPSDTGLVRSSSSQEGSVAKATATKKEQHITVSLHKGKEGLGFSVVGIATEHKGDLGIYIQDIQKGGLAEKSGKLFKGDQIVSINGRALAGVSHSSAIKMLQKAKGQVELKLIRSSSPVGPPADIQPINMVMDDKDQYRWRQIETIELTKGGKGFGFGIVSVKKGGVDICKIAEGSVAAKDGRLKVNDHLLQINNQNTTNMSADDVMKILKGAKSSVKLVVARMVTGQVQPTKGLVVNEPDADLEQFAVELEKERNGLGITIAGLKKEDSEEELRGIYVSSVAPDGPASREGRIREGDQILQVNNTSLIGLENMAAAAVLRNTNQRVRLVIGRRRYQQSPDLTSSTSSGNHHGNTITMEANNKTETGSAGVSNNNMFLSDDSVYAKPLTAAEELRIKKEWSEIVGKEYTIVVAQFAKSIPDTGLGIRVEGRVDLDDNQQPIEGGHHHIIELVREDGPVYKHGALKQNDEILEVNGISMINLEYNAAIQVIKATPHHVRIVAARKNKTGSSPVESPNSELLRDIIFPGHQSLKSYGETNSMEGAHTSESEDDKKMHTPEKTKSLTSLTLSSTLSTSASDDNRWKSELARRRAERDSWRKRHEEEKERLRIRIEKNRQDIQRQLKEKEAEFNRMQEELEREQRSLKELQQEKLAAGDYTGVDVPLSYKSYMEEFGSSPTWDHVLYNHRKKLRGAATRNTSSPMEDIKVSDSELGFDSDTSDSDVSSPDLPSPIPPSTRWCQVTTDISLYKGSRGLGFSILDFMDKDENSVILICSIVSGGVADRNGQLQVGDKLIAINHQDVVGKLLPDVVNILTMIERGTVIITVAHKLVVDEEERAFFGSMGGGSGEFPSIREENSLEMLPSVNTPMNGSVDEIIAKPLMAKSFDNSQQHSGGVTASAAATSMNTRSSLQSSSTPHLNDSHRTHKKLVDLKETVNVTSTSSLYTPLSHTSGMVIDEQLRRSMPDLLDKLPSDYNKRYTDLKKVNTLPHKRNKNKLISPTPSSSFMPLNLGAQQSESPSPVRSSLSQSMNSAFSRVTPDKLSNSDSNVYHKGREALNRNDEVVDEPVLDTGGDLLAQQIRPAITTATIDMAATKGPKDTVATNNYHHNGIQTTPIKQPSDRRQILQPLHQPIISQPRIITITRGNTGLGMSLACDAETDSIVVKNILGGSSVGRDGRIRIGDCIIAINHESLEGVSLSQAKAILRASSLNPSGVTITYIPCPQGYVPTIATNQYLSNESSGPSSPDNLGYGDHVIEQPRGRQDFIMSDQQPVRDIPHKIPAVSHDPMMLPGYPDAPGSAEMSRPLQQNRMSYQSVGMGHKHLTNHPYSDSKVSYHPANPYSSYQVVPPQSVYSLPNTPRAEKFQPPPSYEVHMMTRQISHGERQQQKPIAQQQPQQLFGPAPVPTTASVTPVNYHMVDQPHPQSHPQQQQQMFLSTAPPSYHRTSPVRMMSDVQQQSRVQPQQQFHPASYAVDTHPIRLTEAQQQAPLPAYPMEPHPSLGDQQQQQQQMYYIGAQGYSSEPHPGGMHYSQQLGKSPAHHNDAATALSQSAATNPVPPVSSYQIPITSHMVTGPPDSFSHSSQQKAPPPSYESYVRTSVHRQSRSQSPITTASMIPHQHSASDNSLGKLSTSSLFQSASRSHQRDPATGVVSDAGRSPMVVRGHSAQGQYSPLLNKTDSKSRSGGDLHIGAGDGSGSKVLRNTSSGALRRYSGSGFLNKPPQYQASPNHPSGTSDNSREDGGRPSVYEVELTKDVNGSLGISILGTPEGDRKRDEPVGGVFVITIAPQVTTKLKSGDKILEVNGKSLLQCTQQEAVEILCAAANPVKLVVQSCYSHIRMRNQGSQQRKGSSSHSSPSPIPAAGRRAAIHSWYIDEEEDPQLRKSFPNAEGHLFEVTLHRDGKKSLGMNLVPNEHSMSKGIIITVVQPGGVADSTGKVKPGDVILQVDDVLVMDLKQEEVVALLKRPNPSIHLVLMRPMAHLMGLHLQIPRGAHTNAEQSGQGALSDHMISPSPFDQTDGDDGSQMHPDVTALTATKIINLTKDNVHGLGFSVMEEKVNKRLVVMVKDVVVGGPAYREGQLQIGDILLSIDGKSVVGESYNTTLHLLKQAKTKGSATLIFAPGSLNGTSPGESPTKEASPVISPLPLTTKPSPTRDGNKQPEASAEQQGSSSRKNSTSEPTYDTRVVRSTRKKSSKERKVKKKPDSYRQSSVDELEENMQKLQQKNKLEQLVPEKDEPSTTYEEFEVEVTKGSGPLGLKVVGGADTNWKDVVIKEIVPNTQADIDGQLRPGDHILKVNGENLKYSTHLQAMQAIWNSGPRIKLCVRRKLSATNDGNFSFNESLHSPCMEVEVIELVKPEQAGLGLIIGSREDRDGVFVDEVVMNGAAHKDGRIRSGDKILAINGQDVSATKQDLVAIQLQGCKGRISLTVGHAVGMSPVKDRSPDIGKYPLSIGPPVEVHHSQQSPPSYPDYNNNSDNIDPNRTSSSSLQVTSSVNNYDADSYPPSYHSSSPPVRLSPQVSHDPPPYPSGTNIQQHHMSSGDPHPYPSQDSTHKEITLHRGPSGLGFTFVGGNDVPFYIKDIAKDGVADKDGRLQRGDQLIAVNGISIQGASYQYVLENLKKVQGDIKLMVIPS